MNAANWTIWCNARFSSDVENLLREGIRPHRLIMADQTSPDYLAATPTDAALAQADIAFGQPAVDALLAAERIRWVHITSAGYTRYDTDAFRAACRERNLILTNSSTVYAEPCAQHAAAFVYAHARQLPWAMRDQLTERTWPTHEIRQHSRLLGGERVLIYGFGAIGRRLVELLAPLRMQMVAVRRAPTGNEPIPTLTPTDADSHLPQADIVINLLPANASSQHFFSAERIQRMKRSAVLINIGRGSTVDQEALLHALETQHLAAALLDVTTPEPLPPAHPLWHHPRCTITPHSAGGFAGEQQALVQHFLTNLQRFHQNLPLHDRVI